MNSSMNSSMTPPPFPPAPPRSTSLLLLHAPQAWQLGMDGVVLTEFKANKVQTEHAATHGHHLAHSNLWPPC